MIELHRQPASGQRSDLKIKIVGLGGAGSNALDRIHLDGIPGAELIAANTDAQALAASVAPIKVQLGRGTTRGLGAGGDPEIGYAAAEESVDDMQAALEGAGMVVVCAGLGGGTGSGAAPLIANFGKHAGALVIALVTLPFTFEGRRRMAQAEQALGSLAQQADLVICFENDRMGDAVSPRAGIQEAFATADQTISQSIRAIAAMLQRRGLIHVGFDELAAALRHSHARAIFGYGEGDGDNRAHTALERALRSPLMDRGRLLADVHSVLVHVAGGPSTTLNEITVLMDEFNRHISDSTRILFSTSVDPQLSGKISVTLISSVGAAESEVRVPIAHFEAQPQPTRVRTPEPTFAEIAPVIAMPAPTPIPAPRPQPASEPEVPVELPAVAAIAPAQPVVAFQPPLPAVAAPAAELRQGKTNGKHKTSREEKQEQMSFEPVTRGRFEKSEPTIIDGQDLDVPAFMRMNIRLK